MWNLDLFRKSVHLAVLGSGSRGNASVVWSGDDAVLVDCGFSPREVDRRLRRVGVPMASIRAVLVTHEHGDHIGGVSAVARQIGVPVHLTAAARRVGRLGPDVEVEIVQPGRRFSVGLLEVEPFRVPHDTVDTLGFVVGSGPHRVGFATDMGSIRRSVVERLRSCRAVLLEFNHDEHMLWAGDYPEFLKERVGGDRGHLSNRQGAELLSALAHSRVEHVVLGHLSEQNNEPALALAAARQALVSEGASHVGVTVADQRAGSKILSLTD
jgi:phosphoribosyl 1,2-cyclic phosphodiesterase